MARPQKYNDEFKKMIVNLHRDGEEIKDISDKYNVSESSIRQWINVNKKDTNAHYEFHETALFSIDTFIRYMCDKNKKDFSKLSNCKGKNLSLFYGELFSKKRGSQNLAQLRQGWLKNAAADDIKKYKERIKGNLNDECIRIKSEWQELLGRNNFDEDYENYLKRFLLRRGIFYSYRKDRKEIEKKKEGQSGCENDLNTDCFEDYFDIIKVNKKEEQYEILRIKENKALSINELKEIFNQYNKCKEYSFWSGFSKLDILRIIHSSELYDSEDYDFDEEIDVVNDYAENEGLNDLNYVKQYFKSKDGINNDAELKVYYSIGNIFDIFYDMETKYVFLIGELYDAKTKETIKNPDYIQIESYIKNAGYWCVQCIDRKKGIAKIIVNGNEKENLKDLLFPLPGEEKNDWQRKYEELGNTIPDKAFSISIMLVASCFSINHVRECIESIMNRSSFHSGEALVNEFQELFERHKYEKSVSLLSELKKISNLPDSYYYICGKLVEYGFIDEKESVEYYEECIENTSNDSLFKGLAAVELLYAEIKKEIPDKKKIDKLEIYARESNISEYYEYKGDFYATFASKINEEFNYKEAIKNYMIADNESAYNKANLLIERLVTNKNDISWINEVKNQIWDSVKSNYVLKVGALYREKLIDIYKSKAQSISKNIPREKLRDLSTLNTKYVTTGAKETFVFLEIEDATQAVLRSLSNRTDIQVFVLCYQLDKNKREWISKFYPEVIPIDYAGENFYDSLDLYNLDYFDVTVDDISAVFKNRKIHFVALSSDKTENLSFAMKIIEDTYVKQLVYNNYMNLLGFSLKNFVDLVTDVSEDNFKLYIDTLIGNFDNFYIPVKNINYGNEISKQLLIDRPLFLSSKLNDKRGTSIPKLAILGDDDTVIETIKNIVSVINYSNLYDDNKNIPEITVVSDNVKKIEDKLKFDCSNIEANPFSNYFDLKFYEFDVLGNEFIRLFDNLDEEKMNSVELELKNRLRNVTYFICATSLDSDNVKLGVKIRETTYSNDYLFEYRPSIVVLCRNMVYANRISEIRINNTIYSDAWYASYDIVPYGVYYDCYSYKNIYENFITIFAKEINGQYYSNEDDANKRYYSLSYNRDSSEMAAVYLIYRMFSANVFEEDVLEKWRFSDFEKHIDRYTSKFQLILKGESYIEESQDLLGTDIVEYLSRLEHTRWCCFEMSRGFKKADRGQVERYIHKGVQTHQLHIAKLHPYIVDWQELGERNYSLERESIREKDLADSMNCLKRYYVSLVKDSILYYFYLMEKLLYKECNCEYKELTMKDRFGTISNIEKAKDCIDEIYYEYSTIFNERLMNDCESNEMENYWNSDSNLEKIGVINDIIYNALCSYYMLYEEVEKLEINYSLDRIKSSVSQVIAGMSDKLNKDLETKLKQFRESMEQGDKNEFSRRKFYFGIFDDKIYSGKISNKKVLQIIQEMNLLSMHIIDLLDDDIAKSGDKLQGWIDNLMKQNGLKVASNSVRDGNRNMIRDLHYIVECYLQKNKNKNYEMTIEK